MSRSKRKVVCGHRIPIPSGTVGAISELKVSMDLLRRGYGVFRALSQSCSCDLMVTRDRTSFRIEVTTGYKWRDGKLSYGKKQNEKFDYLAVYCEQEDKIYYFPDLPPPLYTEKQAEEKPDEN